MKKQTTELGCSSVADTCVSWVKLLEPQSKQTSDSWTTLELNKGIWSIPLVIEKAATIVQCGGRIQAEQMNHLSVSEEKISECGVI